MQSVTYFVCIFLIIELFRIHVESRNSLFAAFIYSPFIIKKSLYSPCLQNADSVFRNSIQKKNVFFVLYIVPLL